MRAYCGWVYRLVVVYFVACFIVSCGGSDGGSDSADSGQPGGNGGGGDNSGFDYGSMLVNLADNIIVPNYSAFKTAAQSEAAESGAIAQYCAAIGTDNEALRLVDAKAAWRSLIALWQRAELHNFGPVAGQNNLLRNQIYAYADIAFDSCRTDRAVISLDALGEDFNIKAQPESARGLAALEYLLFNENLSHTCPESVVTAVPAIAEWDERPDAERKLARCDYASALSVEIAEAAADIESGWMSTGGNYRAAFIDVADDGALDVVLNLVSDALFYIEKETKDKKLGIPLALKSGECATAACPDAVESPYAQQSLQNVKANLQSFLDLYTGGSGLGFDDLIAQAGGSSTNAGFAGDVNAAIALVDAMLSDSSSLVAEAQRIVDQGLAAQCQNSNANPATIQTERACALHGYAKRITDRLRTDFVTYVGVDLPDRVQGDAD